MPYLVRPSFLLRRSPVSRSARPPLLGWDTVGANKNVPNVEQKHDDVFKWKHLPRYWPFVQWIHRSPVNFPHKGQWRGALMFSLICAWINGRVNNGEAGDLRRHSAHYDVIVMKQRRDGTAYISNISAQIAPTYLSTCYSSAGMQCEIYNTSRKIACIEYA